MVNDMKGKDLDDSVAIKIKESARSLFIRKGYDGTTMQAIADASEVNKSLLHYYYRGKDNLFLVIFEEELGEIFAGAHSIMGDPSRSMKEKLYAWIDTEARVIADHPDIPLFLISEFRRNPELVQSLMKKLRVVEAIGFLAGKGEGASRAEKATPLDDVLLGIFSLLVFPSMVTPIIDFFREPGTKRLAGFLDRQKALAKELVDRHFPS